MVKQEILKQPCIHQHRVQDDRVKGAGTCLIYQAQYRRPDESGNYIEKWGGVYKKRAGSTTPGPAGHPLNKGGIAWCF